MSDTDDRNLPALMPPSGERNLIFASPECGELFGALAEAQGKMGNPKKTKTATVRGTTKDGKAYSYDYKYAPLEEVIDVIRAPMSAAGMIYRQFLAQRDGAWVMRTVVAHRSGQWYGCDYPLFADKPGAQGFASGVSYARRYGLMLALGLCGEDDDDANVADGQPVTTVYAKDTPPRPAARKAPPAPADDPFTDGPPSPVTNGNGAHTAPARDPELVRASQARDRIFEAIAKAGTVQAVDDIVRANAGDLELIKARGAETYNRLMQHAAAHTQELLASA